MAHLKSRFLVCCSKGKALLDESGVGSVGRRVAMGGLGVGVVMVEALNLSLLLSLVQGDLVRLEKR